MKSRLTGWLSSQYPAVTMWSPMPASGVTARIEAAAEQGPPLVWLGLLDQFGIGDGRRVWLRYRNGAPLLFVHGASRNSFRPLVAVQVEALATGGSQIRLRPRSPRFAMVFMLFWLLLVAAFLVLTLSHGLWSYAVMPAGMFAFGIGLMAVGRAMGRSDLDFLHEWAAWQVGAHDEAVP